MLLFTLGIWATKDQNRLAVQRFRFFSDGSILRRYCAKYCAFRRP